MLPLRDAGFIWFVLRDDFLQHLAGDVGLGEAQLAKELGAFLRICEQAVDGVKVGFRFAWQVNIGSAVGFEGENVGVVLETNEGNAEKIGPRGVPAPKAFLIEQES